MCYGTSSCGTNPDGRVQLGFGFVAPFLHFGKPVKFHVDSRISSTQANSGHAWAGLVSMWNTAHVQLNQVANQLTGGNELGVLSGHIPASSLPPLFRLAAGVSSRSSSAEYQRATCLPLWRAQIHLS